ncbi:MAG: extracellular solute-binding protein [Oliverpabstia sp.]
MKTRKRVLAVILAGCTVFGMTGCMKKTETSKKAADDAEAVEVPEDIWEPYAEEVTLSTVLQENSGITWENGDDYENNTWYRAWKEKFNVKVVNDWVSNDYATKLNLSIAEGNLPDVFKVNAQQLQELQESGLILDLTDIFESQASDRLKGYMDEAKDTFETGFTDGKLYGIPQLSYGSIDMTGQLYLKRDWLEETGMEVPQTMDEFEAVAKAMKEKHGGYVMTETQTLDGMKIMANGWGAYPGIWIEKEDGTIGYGSVQPEMKTVLENYAKWYSEGLIDTEFTITDGDKLFQKCVSGEAGISPFTNWFAWGVGPTMVEKMSEDEYFDAYAIPSATGEATKQSVMFNNVGYIVVSKECKNPEAVIRLLNFYAYVQDETDDPELLGAIADLGTILYAFRVLNPQKEYDNYVAIQGALEKDGTQADPAQMGLAGAKYKKCVAAIENHEASGGGEYLLYASPHASHSVGVDLIDNDLLVYDKRWGMPTETLSKSGSTLDDILDEGFTKIIVGEEPIEYFDTLVENWKTAGGEQATQEVNETYGN